MKKRLIGIFMAILTIFTAFAGCTQPESGVSESDSIPEKSPHLSANGIETNDNGYMRTELTAIELTELMGNGTNLGNTMEAVHFEKGNFTDDITVYETQWAQPLTSQDIMDGIKAAGFDSIRIPVAWMTNATTFAFDGNYTISEAYFNRVEEIINYALNAGLYVIINDHWDGGWYGLFGSENEATRELAMEAYISMWTQISERYKEYSDYLIFEGANEEIGGRFDEDSSLYSSDSEISYMSTDECYALANKINQAFVDTVRATGENNANRFLLIPGYSTTIDRTCDTRYVMPTDTAKDKLMVSVHYYDPGSFCSAESPSAWGTKGDYEEMNNELAKMAQFTEQGYGVVIGEYAVFPTKDDNLKENAVQYHENFLDICDLYGYTSCLWDCSDFFVRKELKMRHDELAALYLSRNNASYEGMTTEEIANNAKERMNQKIENGTENINENALTLTDDNAIAWLMWIAGDWNVCYHAGDEYNPDDISVGVVNTDVEITGDGLYTVGLDFTGATVGYSNNLTFAAVGIANGETLYPDYVIDIRNVIINGETVELCANPYTTTDSNNCTRVNLYNQWVTSVPNGVRTVKDRTNGLSPCVLDITLPIMNKIETVYVEFYYGPQK